jgi:MFS family permease
MMMARLLRPQQEIDARQLHGGLNALLYDGVCSQVMGVLTSGAILAAFALELGASNFVIGLIAASGPLTQLLQIPAIFLINRTRMRKLLCVTSAAAARVFWFAVALVPWLLPVEYRIPSLIACLLLYHGIGTLTGCAYSSWVRDLIPEAIMGKYFGRRLAMATAVGAVLTLVAGFGVEAAKQALDDSLLVYSGLFAMGGISGLVGAYFLARIPEPTMDPHAEAGVLQVLSAPFRDRPFRRLLTFLGLWNFAINLAAPFFAVYMLRRLEMPLYQVLVLSVFSQVINVIFFRIWGGLADRFTNKSVLNLSGTLFIISIACWPFLTMPESHMFTMPLLVIIHGLAGVSTAGVALCSGNIALKLAPHGRATAFLAANAIVNGAAATLAPIIAGAGADWFQKQQLVLSLEWLTAATSQPVFQIPAFDLRGLDFLFVIAVIFGLYAMHRLLSVQEAGQPVADRHLVTEVYSEVRKAFRSMSNVAGLRHLTYFPYENLQHIKPEAPSDEPTDGHA